MRFSLALLVGIAVITQTHGGDEYPSHTLKSDALKLTCYLPDAETGFYRGTRFDWSGVFMVEFGQHKLFGPWKDKHNPNNNDDIVGPSEEFGSSNSSPLNYKTAKVGERFLKIGVGELEKPKEDAYRFFHNYKIAKAGTWKVTATKASITFAQSMTTDYGYGYDYAKTVSVAGNSILIRHTLENTGKEPITTDCYNHNFFNVDGDAIGKNYELALPFTPKIEKAASDSNPIATWHGQSLQFTDTLERGSIYYELGGFSSDAKSKDAGFNLKHKPSGVRVSATADHPLSRFHVWGMKTTLCPEPFVQLDVAPGKTVAWSWKYEFSK